MLADSKKITEIQLKYEIDIYQFWILFCRCINDYESLSQYDNKFNFIPINKIKELETRNLIKPLGNIIENGKEKITFLDIHVTDYCLENFFKDCDIVTEEMGEELLKIYPDFFVYNGVKTITKGGGEVNGIHYDRNNFIEHYLKNIKYSEELHNKIIAMLPIAKKKGLIIFTFRNFIHNRLWESLLNIVEETEGEDVSKVRTI